MWIEVEHCKISTVPFFSPHDRHNFQTSITKHSSLQIAFWTTVIDVCTYALKGMNGDFETYSQCNKWTTNSCNHVIVQAKKQAFCQHFCFGWLLFYELHVVLQWYFYNPTITKFSHVTNELRVTKHLTFQSLHLVDLWSGQSWGN